MRDTSEFPGEQPDTARAVGLRRLSRLTWRATQLSAVTAVGFATLFARTAPAQTASGETTTAPAAQTSSPAVAPSSSSPGRSHRNRGARATASASAQATAQPVLQAAQVTTKASRAAAAPSKSPTLAPPATAPAPTVSSASHGGG